MARETGKGDDITLRGLDLVNCLNFMGRHQQSVDRFLAIKDLFGKEDFYQGMLYVTVTDAFFQLERVEEALSLV